MAPRRALGGIAFAGVLAACGGDEGSGGTEPPLAGSSSGGDAAESSSGGALEDSTTLPPLPDPSADDGPSAPSQSSTCKTWVACAMARMDPDVDAIVDEYGSLGTCWTDDATAAACDAECEDALQAAKAEADAAGEPLPGACEPPRDVPLDEVVAIVDAHCVDDCHEPSGEHPSLDLSESPRDELIYVYGTQASMPFVTPGDHEESYLWHKISGTQASAGGSGSRMPEGQPALTEEQIDAIADWIDIGAPP